MCSFLGMTASWTFWVALAVIRIECEAIMYEPNFVSDWYPIAAGTNETLKIYHNLGDTPVKIDIQVKINESGEDYIFSGLGSSQRDDDMSTFPIGGVVYKYNHEYVQLGVPFRKNTAGTAPKGLTYTGSDSLYYGPTNVCGPYLTGHVRARVWLEINMPTKVYETSVYMSNNEGETFQEIPHNLGYYPDMVTVQTRLGNSPFMSDGVGAMFLSNTSAPYNSIGGVLFGYDDTKIRLWVPSKFGNDSSMWVGGVFAASDGYILGTYRDGVVNIAAWKIDCSQQVLHKTFSVGDGVIHPSVIEFPCAFTLHNYLVSVQAIEKSMKNVRYRIKVVDNMTTKPKNVDRVIPSISSYSNFTFERNGIRVWKAYNIGQGCLISNITTVEAIKLQVIEDSGHINFHELKQKINVPETDSVDMVICSTEGCTKTFTSNEELTNHLYSEKCTLVFDQKSSCSSDISKVKYLEKVSESSINKQLIIMPSATKQSTYDSDLDMGWALKDERKNKRFNKNQTDYLNEKFNKGQTSGRKEDPYSVSEAMLNEKNGDGSRRFTYSEILSVQQVTSYFSRLCKKMKLDESSSDAVREETISNLTQHLNSDN